MSNLSQMTDPKEFTERLRRRVDAARINEGSGRMTLKQQLDCEALDLALAGDIESARHRLRLWTKPKWGSEGECREAYREAMAAKGAQ